MAGSLTRARPAAIIAAEQANEAAALIRQMHEGGGDAPPLEGTRVTARTHTTEGRLLRGGTVTMWKPGPGGYRRRQVPEGNIRMNQSNGWLTHCPDCGEYSCPDDPNLCPAVVEGIKFIECDVPGCNEDRSGPKRIYARDLRTIAVERADDPNRISLNPQRRDAETQLKNAMRRHVIRFHPEEAEAQGYLRTQVDNPDVILLDQDD